jgi:hypothetical protein
LLEQRITLKEDRATLKLHAMPISSAGYKEAEEIGKTYETLFGGNDIDKGSPCSGQGAPTSGRWAPRLHTPRT